MLGSEGRSSRPSAAACARAAALRSAAVASGATVRPTAHKGRIAASVPLSGCGVPGGVRAPSSSASTPSSSSSSNPEVGSSSSRSLSSAAESSDARSSLSTHVRRAEATARRLPLSPARFPLSPAPMPACARACGVSSTSSHWTIEPSGCAAPLKFKGSSRWSPSS